MGLHADITSDVQQAFDADLADAVQDILYVEKADTGYSPSTGTVETYAPEYPTRGVVSPIEKRLIDGEAFQVGDVEVLILQAELNAEPQQTGTLVIGDETHHINGITSDPAGVSWTLYTRVV